MSQEGEENQGTGLRDIYNILFNETPERVRSLTFHLGESPEDNIIDALCLIILRRGEQARNKLQMLGDNYLASHLAEIWEMSDGNLEDFGVRCGNFQDFTGECLAALARIFTVLSEHRLCDPLLRNLAYKRALSVDSHNTSICGDIVYDRLREEAKDVCGPQFAVWMCSSRLGSYPDPCSSLAEGNTTLKESQDPSVQIRGQTLPSPLQANSSELSYPTHLEISIAPTATYEGDKIAVEAPKALLSQKSSAVPSDVKNAPEISQSPVESQMKSNQPLLLEDSHMDAASSAEFRKSNDHFAKKEHPKQTLTTICEPKFTLPTATNISQRRKSDAEEEDDAIFYSFVILHAPQDTQLAESMKEELESVISDEGATFSEEFAVPGKSQLRCIEDAINNSAFTLLLLTRNFNTRMLEVETDSALINSINKRHKHNSVIPVLPKENRMPYHHLPIVLQTIIPLDENKSFEKKIKKALSPVNIRKQRRIWLEEQKERKLSKQRQKPSHGNFYSPMDSHSGSSVWPPPQNIHIANANYIMIGNDSQMTVDFGNKNDAVDKEDEQ